MSLPLRSRTRPLSVILSTSLLIACGDSGTADPSSVDGTAGTPVAQSTDANVADNTAGLNTASSSAGAPAPDMTATGGGTGDETAGSTSGTDANDPNATSSAGTDPSGSGGESGTTAGTSAEPANNPDPTPPADNPPPPTVTPPSDLTPPSVTGSDLAGNEDDSPTATETASLVGPFLKDTSRPNGPPSAPQGLTMLMAGEDFVEMSWAPSSDDQSVEAYEIYRDGALQHTIRGRALDGGQVFPLDYRSWITTSYTDCNYTKYTICDANPIVPGSSYSYQVAAIDNEGMRSELSQPMVFQTAQRQSGGADLTGYSLIFNEEFEADTLDRTFWKTSLPWGENKIINLEKQYFVNLFGSDPLPVNPFVMTGSTLQITGTVTPPELLARANNQPYLSGVITTKDKFKMTYGYVEMKARVTGGTGFLSTFYLFNQDFEKNKPEIDILEYNGGKSNLAFQTYHYHDSNRFRSSDGERHSTPTMESPVNDLSTDYHTYSVLWEPELIVWYIDGSEVRRLTGPRVSDEPMNIIAQLVVGSEWIGEPDPAALPKTYEIDYIKAWQKQ